MNQETVEHILYTELDLNGELQTVYYSVSNIQEFSEEIINDSLELIKHIRFKPINGADTYQLYVYSNDLIYSPELRTVYVMDSICSETLTDILQSTYTKELEEYI